MFASFSAAARPCCSAHITTGSTRPPWPRLPSQSRMRRNGSRALAGSGREVAGMTGHLGHWALLGWHQPAGIWDLAAGVGFDHGTRRRHLRRRVHRARRCGTSGTTKIERTPKAGLRPAGVAGAADAAASVAEASPDVPEWRVRPAARAWGPTAWSRQAFSPISGKDVGVSVGRTYDAARRLRGGAAGGCLAVSTATKIERIEVTWNPTTGCDRISPGCDHCYALTLAKR